MNPFDYHRAASTEEAIREMGALSGTHGCIRGAKFLGGGTNLIDLMKAGVEHPAVLVDITRLELTKIEPVPNGGLMIGALVRNSDLANDQQVIEKYPLLSQALLSGASPQLRNMATTGGNLLQRTRCYYFTDTAFPACNKRAPGTGCAAIEGFNRIHAILGQTDRGPTSASSCIATNPSDMNVALAALGATVHVQSAKGKRSISIADFHRLPGSTPEVDTNLKADELITAVELPAPVFAKNSCYLKVRDRQSYAFALVSVAAGLEMDGTNIKSAAIALGGMAHKPWRSVEAEKQLAGSQATRQSFEKAADLALTGARGYEHNAFKIQLAKQSIIRALTLGARGTTAGAEA
jgi:xanthine dehydrogenase YagS FAD-binding subunit